MHHRRRSMFPSAEQFIISTGRTWCGGAHARRRRGGRAGGMPSTVLRATAGRNFFRNGCLAEGGCGVRAYCACACDTAAGRSSFRTGCFAEGGCGAEPRAVGPGLPVPGVRALLCPGPHGRAAGLPWTPAGLCRLAEKLGLNPGCSLARRSPVPKLRSEVAARAGRIGCGSRTKPEVPVEDRIADFIAGLARLSPTPCGCFGADGSPDEACAAASE